MYLSRPFILALVIFCLHGVGHSQTAPTVWPLTWHTWVVTSVKVGGQTDPQYDIGRLIMFDSPNQVTCRYWEQNLVNLSTTRQADYCDYAAGKHYIMNDTKKTSVCSDVLEMKSNLTRLVYPQDFIDNAKFLGKTHVGQLDCNHFYAPAIKLSDGQYVQMDVWVDVAQALPCQISTLNLKTQEITTWAFDGFALAIPHSAVQQCSIPKIMCSQENWLCQSKKNADQGALGSALGWTCSTGQVNCAPINPGGDHYFPNTLDAHCNWAFDSYYRANRYNQGIDACNFGGVAELVPPPIPPPAPTTSKRSLPRAENSHARDIPVLHFLRSMTGASAYPYDLACLDSA